MQAVSFVATLLAFATSGVRAGDGNRLAHLDEFCDPYYVGLEFPKLVTPQWVGADGVVAVVTLGIDDMRETTPYEAYLRPILQRLKEIDGRAAVSIMTNQIDPGDPHLQTWLAEGLSIETHTADHPCPCLEGGDFAKARSTFERCVDQMGAIPGNRPVAFRFPCMDSLNTPSPRAFVEIFNKTTAQGNFLQISSSVCNIFTADDPELTPQVVQDEEGRSRFVKYAPFSSFVNKVHNYPYPYVIGGLCWEFPCAVPDDWQGQHLHQPNNPLTVRDLKAMIDATVVKQGVANIVFHPHAWIRSGQMIDVIDYAHDTYGDKVLFLNFRECLERLKQNMLAGQLLRAANGQDGGLRLLDLNDDGYLDVVIGNESLRRTRTWDPDQNHWNDTALPVEIVRVDAEGNRRATGVRFGILPDLATGQRAVVTMLGRNSNDWQGAWQFIGSQWKSAHALLEGLEIGGQAVLTSRAGVDQGVRMRDLDQDGFCELIVGNPQQQVVFVWSHAEKRWKLLPFRLPPHTALVDADGRDAGLRFVDIDEDGYDDVYFSNERRYALNLFEPPDLGWVRSVRSGRRGDGEALPMIVRAGANNGAWFAKRHLWLQNEDTDRLPDGVNRRTLAQLLHDSEPNPRSAEQSWKSIRVRPGFRVELVAAEPLVMDPIALDWGADGKLWVVEMADYPLGLDDQGKPGGRVRYLEDTDGDGAYDNSTLFLDEIAYPTGVMAWRDGVLVSAAPDLFFAKDSDGDGTADVHELLYRGFGEGNQQHRVNGFDWGLDNWIYLANGDSGGVVESVKLQQKVDISGRDLRIQPDDGFIDAEAGQTQFGRHRDDHGNWFGCSNPLPVRHYVLSDHYLRRNPLVTAESVRRDIARVDNTQLFPISRVLSHWSKYQPPPLGQPHRFTSACSTSVYRDNLFGAKFLGNTFTCAPVHNAVHRRVLVPAGVSFESIRPNDETDFEFLASTDSWFRPTTATTGPDGALWITDMYRLVIEHPEWIDDQREKELFLRAGHDRGRIYRVFPENEPPRKIPRYDRLSTPQLVAALDSPNGRQRDTAQRLLIHRRDEAATSPLRQMTSSSANPFARLQALCTLDGLGQVDSSTLLGALTDEHPTVRRHAVRISEKFLSTQGADGDRVLMALKRLVTDTDPHVRLQLACSLGYSPDPQAIQTLARLAVDSQKEPFFRSAIFSSLTKHNLVEFYDAISKDAGAAKVFRKLSFEMASRLEDGGIMSHMIAGLVHSFDTNAIDVQQLEALTDALSAGKNSEYSIGDETRSRIDRITETAVQITHDDAATINERVAAIRCVAISPNKPAAECHRRLIQSMHAKQPLEIQKAIVESLVQTEDDALLRGLLIKFSEWSPSVRDAILTQALSREGWTRSLISEVTSGAIAPHDIGAAHRQILLTHADPAIKAAAADLFGASGVEASKAQLIARYQTEMLADADPEVGKSFFVRHCSACHQLGGVGQNVGPDLKVLKNRSATAMLTAILDPNQAVEQKYQSYTILTVDGRTETGILAEETSNAVTLQLQQGKHEVILREEIDEIRSLGMSLMPDGIEKEISPADMSHLLAYLEKLGI